MRGGGGLQPLTRNCIHARYMFTGKPWAISGFIPAEILEQNGTAGDNSTAGGTLNPVGTRFSGRMKPPLGGISSGGNVCVLVRTDAMLVHQVDQIHLLEVRGRLRHAF